MTKNIEKNNPILFRDNNVTVLDEARDMFIDVLNEYVNQHPEFKDEIVELKKVTEEAYLNRKVQYLILNRAAYLNDVIQNSVAFTLDGYQSDNTSSSQLYYLKHSKRFAFNE